MDFTQLYTIYMFIIPKLKNITRNTRFTGFQSSKFAAGIGCLWPSRLSGTGTRGLLADAQLVLAELKGDAAPLEADPLVL